MALQAVQTSSVSILHATELNQIDLSKASRPQIPGHEGEEDPFLLPGTRNTRPGTSETSTVTLKHAGRCSGLTESAGKCLHPNPVADQTQDEEKYFTLN